MTLTNQTSSITLNGNGLTTHWPYPFIIPDDASARVGLFDIATSALTLIPDTDYSISGLGEDAGGEVVYPLAGAPISVAKRLVIWREVDYTQDTELTNQTPYYPVVLMDQLDRMVMQTQQLAEESSRSLKITQGSNLDPDAFIAQLQQGAADAAASAEEAEASAIAAEAALAAMQLPVAPVALSYLRRNALNTLYESRTPAQAAADLSAVQYNTPVALTPAQKGQARANISAGTAGDYYNKLINGGFDVWQRGTSIPIAAGTTGFGPDRWAMVYTAGISGTASRGAFSSADIGPYFASFNFAGTGAAGSYLRQRIENARTMAGKTVTVSGYLADSVPQDYTIQLVQNFGTGGSAAVTTVVGTVAVGSDVFGNVTKLAVVLPSTLGKTVGANDYLELRFVCTAANAHTLSVAQLSLVEGDATGEVDPYQARHIQQEIALCRRYLRILGGTVNGSPRVDGTATAAGQSILTSWVFDSPMRITPTGTLQGVWHVTNCDPPNLFVGDAVSFQLYVTALAAGSVSSRPNSADDLVILDAEL